MPHRRCLLACLAVLGGLVGVPVAEAQVAMHAVAFVDLAGGESSTAGAPRLHVASNAKQAAELAKRVDRPDLTARLAKVDLRRCKVIGIFAGPMPSSGHRLEVKDVQVDRDTVRITVALIRPSPEQMVSDVISYPYAIVALPRSALPRHATWCIVGTEDEPLVRKLPGQSCSLNGPSGAP